MGPKPLAKAHLKAAVAYETADGRRYMRGTMVSIRALVVVATTVAVVLLVVTGSLLASSRGGLSNHPAQPVVEPLQEETTEPLPATTGETTEPRFDTTEETTEETTETGAYRTGEKVGEQLDRLWETTKDFGSGLWSTLTEKE